MLRTALLAIVGGKYMYCASHLASSARVAIEVFGLDNEPLGSQTVTVPDDGVARGDTVMHLSHGLKWKYTKMALPGGKELPVVTEILGLKVAMPATAWVLTHRKAGGGEDWNVGMAAIEPRDGDALHWRAWSMAKLTAESKARAASAPPKQQPPAPAPAQEDADEDDEDDAAVLARERRQAAHKARTEMREVEVIELDGDAAEAPAAEGGVSGDSEDL